MTGNSPVAGRHVLVVEDDMLVMMMVESILDEAGCTFETARSAERAISLLAQHQFDAAVLDVNLDGRESYPVAEALSARRIPFLFSTGYGDSGLRADYRRYPRIVKPYRDSELLRALRSLMDGSAG